MIRFAVVFQLSAAQFGKARLAEHRLVHVSTTIRAQIGISTTLKSISQAVNKRDGYSVRYIWGQFLVLLATYLHTTLQSF